jgi:hypothetical protein
MYYEFNLKGKLKIKSEVKSEVKSGLLNAGNERGIIKIS